MERSIHALTVIALLVCVLVLLSACDHVQGPTITEQPITVGESYISPSNNWQQGASVWMGAYNGELYFIPTGIPTRRFYSDPVYWLSTIRGGELSNELKISGLDVSVIGSSGEYVYTITRAGDLLAVNLETKSLTRAFSFSEMDDRDTKYAMFKENCYFAKDGSFYLPIWVPRDAEYKEEEHFLHILGDDVLEICTIPDEYWLGEHRYTLERDVASAAVVIRWTEENKEILDLGLTQTRSLFPSDHGLLVQNWEPHNTDCVLYYIDASGNLIPLYSMPQLTSQSAVAVYHDTVYLSFKRWDAYGDIGMKRFENDTLEGTYKISLENYSATKISDAIYDGMYIFDDTGIFVCDENCNIYKLDFDGNVIDTLLENNAEQRDDS